MEPQRGGGKDKAIFQQVHSYIFNDKSLDADNDPMALTQQQMKLVKDTIPILRERGEHISTVFYKTMLKDNPELNNMFNGVNMKTGAQPRALTSLILAFASNISNITEIVAKLERVANKHASVCVRPEHYEIVGRYLLRAFSAVLGPDMTPEVRLAWTKAYWIMAAMLSNREAQIYKDFETWTGWRRFVIDCKSPETREGDVVSLFLKPVDGAPLPPFHPGQYVSLRVLVPGSPYAQIRQYSLSDRPKPGQYCITVKRVMGKSPLYSDLTSSGTDTPTSDSDSAISTTAKGSGEHKRWIGGMAFAPWKDGIVSHLLIDQYHAGDTVELTHPAGEFHMDPKVESDTTPVVLISAGIGMAPLIAMLNQIVQGGCKRPVSWIQGNRSDDMPFQGYVKELASEHSNLRTTFFSTAIGDKDIAESEDCGGYGYYLEALKPESLFLDNSSTEYYVCGAERFMRDIEDYLESKGVDESKIKCELHATGFFEGGKVVTP